MDASTRYRFDSPWLYIYIMSFISSVMDYASAEKTMRHTRYDAYKHSLQTSSSPFDGMVEPVFETTATHPPTSSSNQIVC